MITIFANTSCFQKKQKSGFYIIKTEFKMHKKAPDDSCGEVLLKAGLTICAAGFTKE